MLEDPGIQLDSFNRFQSLSYSHDNWKNAVDRKRVL